MAESRRMLRTPAEFAHGYLTLEDVTEVSYPVTDVYSPESCRGLRRDDPACGVEWPGVGELLINERDRLYPDFGI